ncbi:hypothetical protein PVA39_23250, partial [Pseudomonas sp. CNPSo 3701]|nr:hypothetical protein [Pseudomonas sp. CNPSo 3701]
LNRGAHLTAPSLAVKLFLKNFFFLLNTLQRPTRSSSLQREAHSTALQTAVNTLFYRLRST